MALPTSTHEPPGSRQASRSTLPEGITSNDHGAHDVLHIMECYATNSYVMDCAADCSIHRLNAYRRICSFSVPADSFSPFSPSCFSAPGALYGQIHFKHTCVSPATRVPHTGTTRQLVVRSLLEVDLPSRTPLVSRFQSGGLQVPHSPRGSRYSTIMEIIPNGHAIWCFSPNSGMALYLDPLGHVFWKSCIGLQRLVD